MHLSLTDKTRMSLAKKKVRMVGRTLYQDSGHLHSKSLSRPRGLSLNDNLMKPLCASFLSLREVRGYAELCLFQFSGSVNLKSVHWLCLKMMVIFFLQEAKSFFQ